MNVKFLNPFVEAAFEVLKAEIDTQPIRGELRLEKEPYITEDVTVIISLVGHIEGNVFFSMSNQSAMAFSSRMLGEDFTEFDSLAQSGIAELGNVITGRASLKLSQAGYECTISPPSLLLGKGGTISTLDYARLYLPLTCDYGQVGLHLALRESRKSDFSIVRTPVAQRPKL